MRSLREGRRNVGKATHLQALSDDLQPSARFKASHSVLALETTRLSVSLLRPQHQLGGDDASAYSCEASEKSGEDHTESIRVGKLEADQRVLGEGIRYHLSAKSQEEEIELRRRRRHCRKLHGYASEVRGVRLHGHELHGTEIAHEIAHPYQQAQSQVLVLHLQLHLQGRIDGSLQD